jgi:hypothetical protein
MAFAIGQAELVDLGGLSVSGYPFTLAGWFRVPNVNKLLTLMGVGFSTSGSYHRLVHLGNTTKMAGAVSNTGSSSVASSTIAMTPGQWHHVVGVFEAANSRRVYLDGGNVGSHTGSRPFDGANQFVLGNLSSTDTVDVAEAGIWNVALSADEIGMLSEGMSPLCLPRVGNLLTYQSCVRGLNWPAFGPHATAAAAPSVVAHPRVFYALNNSTQSVPNRLTGPFRTSQGELLGNSAQRGQPFSARCEIGQLRGSGIVVAQVELEGGE